MARLAVVISFGERGCSAAAAAEVWLSSDVSRIVLKLGLEGRSRRERMAWSGGRKSNVWGGGRVG